MSNQIKIRAEKSIKIGKTLQISAAITAGIGGTLIGLGLYNIFETPSEFFPYKGIGAGIAGMSCVVISIPLFASGTVIKCINKHRKKMANL